MALAEQLKRLVPRIGVPTVSHRLAEHRSLILDFAVKILLPTLVAAAGIALLILYVFSSIFRETDDIDRIYQRSAARAAIGALRENMEMLVQEKVESIPASDFATGIPGLGPLESAWSVKTGADTYDAAFVVDADGQTQWASTRRDPDNRTQASAEAYFDGQLSDLLDELPGNSPAFAHTSSVIKAEGSISIAAATVIVPAAGPLHPGSARALRLVLVRNLSPALLANLGGQFQLRGLHILSIDERPLAFIGLSTTGQSRVGYLTWADRSPGSELRTKFGKVMWAVVSLFLLVVGILLFTSWRGFRQAHESRADAIAASLRDDLTGLANRRELMRVLACLLADDARHKEGLSIVYADLDGFKDVNDAYGHEIGDQLLKSAAAGFAFLARDTDLVARLGGDEFAIVITGSDATIRARELAHNMITFFAEPLIFAGRVASVSVSIGIVDRDEEEIDGEEILRRADVAMYAAKSGGRDRALVYEASLDIRRNEGRQIARELRSILDQRQLELMYQPIVDARTRRVVGVEALARWPSNAPRRVPPDVFVPVAEEFGMIEELGQQVLSEACRQATAWRNIFVSVNVSPLQFMNPGFADMVERTLARSGLDARRLEVEVTEGFVIDNADRAMAIIDGLHVLGVSISLDDFGTGYSSIGHLRRFHFDKLKLDRSMVIDILRHPAALRLVQGTIAMADALGLRVTAEGIEDENQASVLRLAGCSLFQGFLFSEPIRAADISRFLDGEPQALVG